MILESKIDGEIKDQLSEYTLRTTRSTEFVNYCDYVKENSVRRTLNSVRRTLNKCEETNTAKKYLFQFAIQKAA
jgi:hypothetical protein